MHVITYVYKYMYHTVYTCHLYVYLYRIIGCLICSNMFWMSQTGPLLFFRFCLSIHITRRRHLEIRYLPRICRAMQCSHSQRASEVGLSMSHRVMVKPRCRKSGAKAQRPHIVTVQLWFCAYNVPLQLFQFTRKIQLSTYWQRWREIYQSFRRVSEELIWNETPDHILISQVLQEFLVIAVKAPAVSARGWKHPPMAWLQPQLSESL